MIGLIYCIALFRIGYAAEIAVADPEAYMTAVEMIRYWGYPAEVHDVITPDGYILDMFRIPYGRFSEANSSCTRPVVIMSHGLGGGGAQFVLNPPESSPAFVLADAGFDVFIINHRGTTYSKRHQTLKPWDNQFWQFTMDEMAKYDSTSSIDRALQISGAPFLYWIGHSQGTIVGFMTLADHPEYNAKVKALFQVAPAGSSGYAKGLTRFGFFAYIWLKPIADFYRVVIGSHEIAFGISFLYRPAIRLCMIIPIVGKEVMNLIYAPSIAQLHVCLDYMHLLFGPPTTKLNLTRAPVYLSHIPCGIATWNGLHWAQMANNKRVEHMDHNPLENVQRYGQETPPAYNYSKVDTPVYFFWSRNDWLATPEDIEHVLLKTLRKEVFKGGEEVPDYNHIDFTVATDCAEKVFKPIAKIVRRQENNMCAK